MHNVKTALHNHPNKQEAKSFLSMLSYFLPTITSAVEHAVEETIQTVIAAEGLQSQFEAAEAAVEAALHNPNISTLLHLAEVVEENVEIASTLTAANTQTAAVAILNQAATSLSQAATAMASAHPANTNVADGAQA